MLSLVNLAIPMAKKSFYSFLHELTQDCNQFEMLIGNVLALYQVLLLPATLPFE